jgi:hypothetical protein
LAATGALLVALPLLQAQPQPRNTSRLGAAPQTLHIGGDKISVAYPNHWSSLQPTGNSWAIVNVPADRLETAVPSVRILIGYIERTDHADAVSQLAEYANESRTRPTFLTIGGWPAFQRVQVIKRPQGEGPPHPDSQMVQITTAIAAGNLLVRLEAGLPSDADEQLKELVLAVGQSLVFSSQGDAENVKQELKRLEALPRHPGVPKGILEPVTEEHNTHASVAAEARMLAAGNSLSAGGAAPILTLAQVPFGTDGEFEVVVSNNGANIVMGKQSCWLTSNDGGQTFPYNGCLPVGDGDSSLAVGQSGNFYHAALGCFGTNCAAVCPANSNCAEIAPSTTNGRTFGALVNAAVCPNSGSGLCALDQEHIAADRSNAAANNLDRVYMAIRVSAGKGYGPGFSVANINCSPDSGAHWSPFFTLETDSDFPRVAVGSDGSFYVVYATFATSGATTGNIRIDKFNACPALNTLTQTVPAMTRAATGGYPKTVSAFTTFGGCEVASGFAGLDRCNDGNILSSPAVAVDDTNANHIYVTWANNTASNNEDILVSDSTNDGAFSSPVRISDTSGNGKARRFMPWACVTGGKAFVTWYDRRAATAGNNDLTDYYAASAGLSGGSLVANNDEFKISTMSDAQCTTWPSGPRSVFDSENCSVQPQNAGVCSVSKTRCDFKGSPGLQCPSGETCQTGNGAVKYGDYNGNACILGRLYTLFSSSAGQAVTGAPLNYFQSFVVNSTPTVTSYTGPTTGVFDDVVNLTATLTLSGTTIGIAGQTLKLSVGSQNCTTGLTTSSGAAGCSLTLNQVPGPYTVTATFATSGNYQASSVSPLPFTITKEDTTTTYTGPTLIASGVPTSFSAVLKEDGLAPISGRTLVITLGTGSTAQTCTTGPTDATGSAACTITPNQLFATTVEADFLGDSFYLPSTNSASAALNVTSQVTISTAPFLDNRSGRDPQSCTVISVVNPNLPPDRTTRSTTIAGPIEVLITNLSPAATLVNPAGTFTGSPFTGSPFEILQPQGLPPGGQVSVGLCFLDPTGAPISFTPVIVSGAIP